MPAVSTSNLPSAAVLKNKGIPAKVHKVTASPDLTRWERVYDPDSAEPVLEMVYIQFTNLALSDIEERFGSMDDWEAALGSTPYKALVDTLSIVWEVDRRQAGKMMLDDGVDDYSSAIGAAFMLSQGSEVDAVVRVLESGVKAAKDLRARLLAEGMEQVEAAEAAAAEPATPTRRSSASRSAGGSEPGSASDAA